MGLVWRLAGKVVIGGEVVVVVVGGDGVGDGVRVGGLAEVVVEGGMIRRRRTLAPGRGRSRRRRRRGSSRGSGLGWRAVRPQGTWRATEDSGTMSGPTAGAEGDGGILGLALGLASAGAVAVAGRRAQPAGVQARDTRALGTGQPAAAEAQEEKIRRISMVRLCTVFRIVHPPAS
jgi:hypothetical protein